MENLINSLILGFYYSYLFIIPLVLWCYNKSLGKRLLFLVISSVYLSGFFSDNFFLAPSIVQWLFLSVQGRRILSKAGAMIAILGNIAISLFYFSVSIETVLILSGLSVVVFVAFYFTDKPIASVYNNQFNYLQKLIVIFSYSGALIIVSYILSSSNFETQVLCAGLFAGSAAGSVTEKTFLKTNSLITLEDRTIRLLLGTITGVLSYYILWFLYSLSEGNLSRYFVALIFSVIITYIVPLIFNISKIGVKSSI